MTEIPLNVGFFVYGAGDRAAKLNVLCRHSDQIAFSFVGFVESPGEHPMVNARQYNLCERSALGLCGLKKRLKKLLSAVNDRRKNFPMDDLLDCRLSGIDVTEPISFLERETGKVYLDMLHPSWMIFSDGFKRTNLRDYFKRAFDIFATSLLLTVVWPIFVLTALGIWLESRGRQPILYRQVRTGQNGAPFELLKFRSMRVDAEHDGIPQWAQIGDERVTAIGRFIRPFRIDELPQILNILRGDMSLVGPRPERLEFVKDLSEKIPYYSERHRVKPGLTGWAQMNFPYGSSEQDAIEKLQYDLYYVKNHSLFLDLFILIQTAEVVLFGKGAR